MYWKMVAYQNVTPEWIFSPADCWIPLNIWDCGWKNGTIAIILRFIRSPKIVCALYLVLWWNKLAARNVAIWERDKSKLVMCPRITIDGRNVRLHCTSLLLQIMWCKLSMWRKVAKVTVCNDVIPHGWGNHFECFKDKIWNENPGVLILFIALWLKPI